MASNVLDTVVHDQKLTWLIELCETQGWKNLVRPGLMARRIGLLQQWLQLDDPTSMEAVSIREQVKVIGWLLAQTEDEYARLKEKLLEWQVQQARLETTPEW